MNNKKEIKEEKGIDELNKEELKALVLDYAERLSRRIEPQNKVINRVQGFDIMLESNEVRIEQLIGLFNGLIEKHKQILKGRTYQKKMKGDLDLYG